MKATQTSAMVSQKKLASDPSVMKRKTDAKSSKTKKETASKKIPGAPKRPASAFFVFMEDFRKSYKKNFPDNKSVAMVTKAGGEKWKAMSQPEKAPYNAKAAIRKTEYEKAKKAFNKTQNDSLLPAESEKSSSEVRDGAYQEASS